MSTFRTESQPSYASRRRSNTAQSLVRQLPPQSTQPLKYGDSKVLNTWVHDSKDTPVILNQNYWPGVAEGDLLQVRSCTAENPDFSLLFVYPRDDFCPKPQLQISIPKAIAETFCLRNNSEVLVTKVDKTNWCADYVEFIFQDQYLGRNDMWRLGEHLVGQCIFAGQEVTFINSPAATIQNIYIGGKTVYSGCVTTSTKAIYRSLSAKITIFIQVCRELWEFAGDGERYNEKIVHSFLPALFSHWREAGTNHIVTIVLISRVFYEASEVHYAAGPLRRDDSGAWYKDFYKVITDLEVITDWRPTLVSLKNSVWSFQRDILLTHHYHQFLLANADSGLRRNGDGDGKADKASGGIEQVRLIGRISFAQDGPVLEALNLALNPTETHYIDRSLSLTGSAMIIVTPGTGFFKVSKDLLRLTTMRLLDQGFCVNLVSLAKAPLHQTPIFTFRSLEPKVMDADCRLGLQQDPLWGHVDPGTSGEMKEFWWEPFWISMTFWDRQMDLPFRTDRFISRAKMHQIQMLGLLELDVLAGIEVPFLPETDSAVEGIAPSQEEADEFDMNIFAFAPESKLSFSNRESHLSVSSSQMTSNLHRSLEKRAFLRDSTVASGITPIEESPRPIVKELPPEDPPTKTRQAVTFSTPSKSPSNSSIHSLRSNLSATSSRKTGSHTTRTRASLASKLTPAWLFSPFNRSEPSEPQTTPISALASDVSHTIPTTPIAPTDKGVKTPIGTPGPSPSRLAPAQVTQPHMHQPKPSTSPVPMMIRKPTTSTRTNISRTFEEDATLPIRSPHFRRSPIGTPPREDAGSAGRRRSTTSLHAIHTALPASSSSSPATGGAACNPTRPYSSLPAPHAALARRWQHVFPRVLYKHTIKWDGMTTPACLPLTVEHLLPSPSELERVYDVFSYDFVLDPGEMRSFFVKSPSAVVTRSGNGGRESSREEDVRRAWALAVMRGMAAVRLAQGFQFMLRKAGGGGGDGGGGGEKGGGEKGGGWRAKPLMVEEEMTPKPLGAADVLRWTTTRELVKSTSNPVYLSMTNEIHRISYTGEAIQVRRYVRRMPPQQPVKYECLMWPKLGGGYTEMTTTFSSHGLENYGWNRLDMLVAGYENSFNESLRYWRTRFIVIPSAEPPAPITSPSGETYSEEETRILGIEKLAEQFTKLRWQFGDEKLSPHPASPVRVLQTTFSPAAMVHDASLMEQLDQLHATALRKKMKSEREIGELSLGAITKAMREDDGVPIKDYRWHNTQYPNSFIGYDLVSWMVREFRDVSTRVQATEWGVKLLEQGLFEHCRGYHTFLDGHYFYRLKGEYSIPMTPRGWFRRYTTEDHYPSGVARPKNVSPRRHKKRLILSQSMVIDTDPQKKSDQAESVILHHDVIHNPETAFHFELQWIGTTARCIDDLIRQWSRTIERHGLKLVEAYVGPIIDVPRRNTFQSCFPIRIALPPPIIPDLAKRVPEGGQIGQYFEYALLHKMGWVIDVEAASMYLENVDVVYSYRRTPFHYSQFIHRSGMGFIQVLGGAQGFLFLTNRLMSSGRMTLKGKDHRAAVAEEIRLDLEKICSDKDALQSFYEEEIKALAQYNGPEEPPPLTL